ARVPAGGALAAGLTVEEAHQAPAGTRGTGGVIQHDDGARPHHGAALPLHLALVEGEVELLGAEPEGGRAPGDERLQTPPVADPAPELGVVDEVPEGVLPQLHLVGPGTVYPARHREHAGAGGGLGS